MKLITLVIFCLTCALLLEYSGSDATKKYNRYLAHLFTKYGNGGTMSFEGLEHLMHSLGLGALEFNPTHTIDEHRPDGYKIPEIILQENDDYLNDMKNEKLQSNTKSELEYTTTDGIENNYKVTKSDEISGDKLLANFEDDSLPRIVDDISEDLSRKNSNDWTEKVSFKEMHDPKHRHPRHHDHAPVSSNRCLSPISLMKLVVDHEDIPRDTTKLNYLITSHHERNKRHTGKNIYEETRDHLSDEEEEYSDFINTFKITPAIFMRMCPALLVQIDQDACAQPIIEEHSYADGFAYAWVYASVAIFIISACGLIGVAIVPLTKSIAYDEILKFLVAVAVGTLCGDALMHLLPHALVPHHGNSEHQEDNHNEPVWLCACAFLTALFMFSLETLLPLIKGTKGHNHGHGHGHGAHSHNIEKPTTNQQTVTMQIPALNDNSTPKEINIMLDEDKVDKKGVAELSPVAFMVILGDGLHNITDGLAIGAAFASDPVTGMATAFAVLCHELPHELGDFALLLKTGVNIRRAIFLNIVSSVLSFMGMAIGLVVAGMHGNMVRWIYAGTAGSFLYIALTDLIPEMGRDGKQDLKNSLIKILGILLGGVIMVLIALNEDDLRILFE